MTKSSHYYKYFLKKEGGLQLAKRNIDGEKKSIPPKLPEREEFSADYSSYGEKREALKELYRKSEQEKKK